MAGDLGLEEAVIKLGREDSLIDGSNVSQTWYLFEKKRSKRSSSPPLSSTLTSFSARLLPQAWERRGRWNRMAHMGTGPSEMGWLQPPQLRKCFSTVPMDSRDAKRKTRGATKLWFRRESSAGRGAKTQHLREQHHSGEGMVADSIHVLEATRSSRAEAQVQSLVGEPDPRAATRFPRLQLGAARKVPRGYIHE